MATPTTRRRRPTRRVDDRRGGDADESAVAALLGGGGDCSFGRTIYRLKKRFQTADGTIVTHTVDVPAIHISAECGSPPAGEQLDPSRGPWELTPRKFLSRGTYGLLLEYVATAPESFRGERVAVKVEDDALISGGEHGIVRALEGVRCGQIRGRPVGLHAFRREDGVVRQGVFTLYELMDGDLRRHRERVLRDYAASHGLSSPLEATVHIAEDVRAQLVCLYRNDPRHVYADLKLENVLFRRSPSGRVSIHVGDLGSMVPRAGDQYVMTFPCPPNISLRTFATAAEALACLSYQVGVLFAALLGMPTQLLRFDKLTSRRRRIRQLRVAIRDYVASVLPAYADRRLSDLVHEDVAQRRSVLLPLTGGRPGRRVTALAPIASVSAMLPVQRTRSPSSSGKPGGGTAPCQICRSVFTTRTLDRYDGRTCGRCYKKITAPAGR